MRFEDQENLAADGVIGPQVGPGGGLVDIESGLFWAYVTDAINSEKRSPGIARCERARLGNDAAVVGAALAALFEQWAEVQRRR